jgi:hypothetical protein
MNENRIIWGLSPHIETTQGLASLSMMKLSVRGKRRAKFIYIPFSNIFGLANFFMSKVNEYYDLYFLKLVCFFNSQCINFCLLVMYI